MAGAAVAAVAAVSAAVDETGDDVKPYKLHVSPSAVSVLLIFPGSGAGRPPPPPRG